MTSKRDGRKVGDASLSANAKASHHKANPNDDEEDELPLVWKKIEKSILQSINVRFDEFEQKIQGLISGQQELTDKVDGIEAQAADHEQRIQSLETTLEEMQRENKSLRSKLSDLEGRSRRNNIKIVGIGEGEEKGRPTDFVSHLIPKLLGAENFDKPVAIDRAHRSLQPMPAAGSKARTIIACLHYAQEKEKILRLCRQRALEYGGKRVFIFPDYTADVMEKRRSFREVQQTLREKNVQHYLRFPARLHVHHQGQVKLFNNPAEAKIFIDNELK